MVGEIKVDNEMLVMRLTSRLELIVVRSCSELRSIMGGRVSFRELESTIGTTILGNLVASPLQLQDTRDGQFCSANSCLDLILSKLIPLLLKVSKVDFKSTEFKHLKLHFTVCTKTE